MASGESPTQTQAWVMDIEPQGEGNYASAAFSSVQGVIDHGLTLPPSDRSGLGATASSHEEFDAPIPSNRYGIGDKNSMRGGSLIDHLCHDGYQQSESSDDKLGLTGNISSETLPSAISPSREDEGLTRDPSATTWSASCQFPDDDSHGLGILEPYQSIVAEASASSGDPQLHIPPGNILEDGSRSQPICAQISNTLLSNNYPYAHGEVNSSKSYGKFVAVGGTQNLQSSGISVEFSPVQNTDYQCSISLPAIERELLKHWKSAPVSTVNDGGGSKIPRKKMGESKSLGHGTNSPLFLNHVRPTDHELSQNHLRPALATCEINPQGPRALIASPSISKPTVLLNDLPLPLSVCVAISEPLQQLHTLSTIAELQALLCDTSAKESQTTFQAPAIPVELRVIFDKILERWKVDDKYRKQLLFLIMEKLEKSGEKKRGPRPLPLTPRDIDKILALLARLNERDEEVEGASEPSEDPTATFDPNKCLCSILRSGKLAEKCLKAFRSLKLADEIRRNAKQVEQLSQQQSRKLEIQEQEIQHLSLECHRLKTLFFPDADSREEGISIPDTFKPLPDRSYHFAEPVENQYWLCLLTSKKNPSRPCLSLNQSWARHKSAKTVWVNRVKCGSCKQSNVSSHTRQYISHKEAATMELLTRAKASPPIPQPRDSPDAISLHNWAVRAEQTTGPPTIPGIPHGNSYTSHMPGQPQLFPEITRQFTIAGPTSPPGHRYEPTPAPSTGYWQPVHTNNPYSIPSSFGNPPATSGPGRYSSPPHIRSLGFTGAKKGNSKSQSAVYTSKFQARCATPGVLTFPTSPQTVSNEASNRPPNNAIGMCENTGHKRGVPSIGQHDNIRPRKRPKHTADLPVPQATVETIRTALPAIKRSWMKQNTASVAQHKAQPECITIPDDESNDSGNASSSTGQLVNPEQTELEPDVSSLFDCEEVDLEKDIEVYLERDTGVDLERDMGVAMDQWTWEEPVVSDEMGREEPGTSAGMESREGESRMGTYNQEPLGYVPVEVEESEEE